MQTKDKILFASLFMILVFILLLAVFGEDGYLDLQVHRARHSQLVKENKVLAMENKFLLDEIDRLKNDLHYIEAVARKELGLVSEKELVFKPQ